MNNSKKYQVIEGGKIRQMPEVKPPEYNPLRHRDEGFDEYEKECGAWCESIKSMPTYPYASSLNFKVGQIVEEGKDFEFTFQVPYDGTKNFYQAIPMNNSTSPNQQAVENKEARISIIASYLCYFINDDGSPVDGFRFRETALALKKHFESLPQSNNKEIRSAEEIKRDVIKKYFSFEKGTNDRWDLQASIKYYLENGKPTGGFLQNIYLAMEEYHNQFHNKEEVNEDELWANVIKETRSFLNYPFAEDGQYTSVSKFVAGLKELYSITKK